MSTEMKAEEAAKWSRVREAVTERWPHIDRDELSECTNDIGQLVEFVQHRVEASSEEVDSVVREFAPEESVADRVKDVVQDGIHDAAESAQFAYMRADECIARRPTESVLTSFVVGIVLGVTVTALWMQSSPEPSVWDQVKHRKWS